MKNDSVDNTIYDVYEDRWYTAFDDPVALLRAESVVKTKWTIEQIESKFKSLAKVSLLDVGCGGGFLSNALAKTSMSITAVDLSETSLATASRFDETKRVNYLVADAYHLPFADASFEVITAMDFLEHVENPQLVIQEFSRVLKPGGLFIFHTFNRNWVAGLVVIKLVEWLVKNTPKNMHVLRLFIKPSELNRFCNRAHMKVSAWSGIKPVLSTITIKSIFTGVVPKELRFELTKSMMISYIGAAEKEQLHTAL